MLDQVKQEIQRYYPQAYLLLEFLKTGGWHTPYANDIASRHQTVLDDISFELTEYHHKTGGIVIRTFYYDNKRIRGIPLVGPNARISCGAEVQEAVYDVMIKLYRSSQRIGTEYHALI